MTPAAFSHSWPLFNYLGNLSSKWLNRGDTALFGDTHLHSPEDFESTFNISQYNFERFYGVAKLFVVINKDLDA